MKTSGIGLVEVIITLLLIGLLLAAFTASFYALPLIERDRHFQQGFALAQEQIEVLKSIPFNNLSNQTNGPFRFVGYPVGEFLVKADGQAHSGANVLELTNDQPASPFSSLALLPENQYEDFTFFAQVKITANPPANWKAGLVLRYQDTQNYYWLYLEDGEINFFKVINGVSTELYDQDLNISANTWYKLEAVVTGTTWQILFNDLLLTTVEDASLNFGLLGLAATEQATAQFDSLTVLGANPGTWNFDNEPVNEPPAGWSRFSPADLPGGQAVLSVEDYNSQPNIKKVTVQVSWQERTGTNQARIVTLLTDD